MGKSLIDGKLNGIIKGGGHGNATMYVGGRRYNDRQTTSTRKVALWAHVGNINWHLSISVIALHSEDSFNYTDKEVISE